MSISDKIRESVYKRASNQCEAMMWVDTIWTRCGMRPLEIHHRLKRSQGGGTLDKAGEIYHLVGLCPIHHRQAHSLGAYEADLLISGDVIWDDIEQRPVYRGPDKFLSKKYPPSNRLENNDNS